MKRLFAGMAILMALPVCWIGLTRWLDTRHAPFADRPWAESSLSLNQIASMFPRTTRNSAAADIEAAAVKLGIVFREARYAPPSKSPEAERLTGLGLGKFVKSQMDRADDAIDPIPPEALRFLADHAPEIAAIRSAASRNPIWDSDVTELFAGPVPNTEDHGRLCSVLAVHALERMRRGDWPDALATLDAAWRIAAAFRARPECASQFVALSADRQLLGLLRKIPPPQPAWSARAAGGDRRRSMLLAVQTEVWMFNQFEKRYDPTAGGGPTGTTPDWTSVGQMGGIDVPLLRIAATSYLRTTRRVVAPRRAIDLCTLDKSAYNTIREKEETSRWNIFVHGRISDVAAMLQLATRGALDAELTRKILESDTLTGSGTLPSSICPGMTWHYQVSERGVTITASRDPFDGSVGGLPLTFVGHRTRRSP